MPPTVVHFYFDAGCAWTWVTSRWLVAAATARDLTITWHPYSLELRPGYHPAEQKREGFKQSHRALRVLTRVRDEEGNDAAGAFYAERGYRVFGGSGDADSAAVLTAVGLDPAYACAEDDETFDALILAEMDAAHHLAGESLGSPILAPEGSERGFFGPVLGAVPDDPGALWDLVVGLLAFPEVHELKRDRAASPVFPARP